MSASPPDLPQALLDELLPPEVERWRVYEARKRAWLAANPGAYPSEVQHTLRVIAEELGL